MQALQGNNAAERPMWAEKGGLDFDGRERWDAWTAMKDVDRASAELKFVQVDIPRHDWCKCRFLYLAVI